MEKKQLLWLTILCIIPFLGLVPPIESQMVSVTTTYAQGASISQSVSTKTIAKNTTETHASTTLTTSMMATFYITGFQTHIYSTVATVLVATATPIVSLSPPSLPEVNSASPQNTFSVFATGWAIIGLLVAAYAYVKYRTRPYRSVLCVQCGAQILQEWNFCSECGAKQRNRDAG